MSNLMDYLLHGKEVAQNSILNLHYVVLLKKVMLYNVLLGREPLIPANPNEFTFLYLLEFLGNLR